MECWVSYGPPPIHLEGQFFMGLNSNLKDVCGKMPYSLSPHETLGLGKCHNCC